MKILSVNVGVPRQVTFDGKTVQSGIFKEPVAGRVALRRHNLEGDGQADLRVHGGEHKAVYCYPFAHYDYWKAELSGREWPLGVFGENFTTDGLLEDGVFVGDRFSVGTAEVVVTQPRQPCYKLGMRMQDAEMPGRFLASGRSGFYLSVVREGEVGAGDEMMLISRDPNGVPVADVMRLYIGRERRDGDDVLIERALQLAALPHGWKRNLQARRQPK